MDKLKSNSDALILSAGDGRKYNCGTMTAVIKADERENCEKYSISKCWQEPYSNGPGAHQHEDNDEVFYVLEGATSILIGDNG